jgi:hypothetical protein
MRDQERTDTMVVEVLCDVVTYHSCEMKRIQQEQRGTYQMYRPLPRLLSFPHNLYPLCNHQNARSLLCIPPELTTLEDGWDTLGTHTAPGSWGIL